MNFPIKRPFGAPDITISVTCHVNNQPKHAEQLPSPPTPSPKERLSKTVVSSANLCAAFGSLSATITATAREKKNKSIDSQSAREACNLDPNHVYQTRAEDLAVSLCDATGPLSRRLKKIQLLLFLLFLSTQGLVSTLVHWRKERLSSHATSWKWLKRRKEFCTLSLKHLKDAHGTCKAA